jgi:hypothetical protein
MPRRLSSCQFDSSSSVLSVYGLVALILAIWPAVAVSAQQPGRPETEAAALARQTLAARLALPIEEIRIVSVSHAVWRDSSLDCPQRDMTYTPVMSSGYKVRLRDVEREHIVHVAGSRAVICSSQADSKLSSATLVSASLKAAAGVRTEVSGRLRIEPARVRIVSTRPARSDSRSCAAMTSPPSGAAFIVDAEAEGQVFRYFTDASVTISCDNPVEKPR